jgi:hypothetical protein
MKSSRFGADQALEALFDGSTFPVYGISAVSTTGIFEKSFCKILTNAHVTINSGSELGRPAILSNYVGVNTVDGDYLTKVMSSLALRR